jgi:hypothetical protein
MIKNRWKSKFARFIMGYGVARLAAQLGIRASAVSHWIAGRSSPDPVNAVAIQKLARGRRVTLSLTDIYRQRRETHCKRGIKLKLNPREFRATGAKSLPKLADVVPISRPPNKISVYKASQ